MTTTAQEIVLLAVVVLFAWNLGAHYTGATMGMPYASRSVSLWPALTIVAVFSLLGATLASHRVPDLPPVPGGHHEQSGRSDRACLQCPRHCG